MTHNINIGPLYHASEFAIGDIIRAWWFCNAEGRTSLRIQTRDCFRAEEIPAMVREDLEREGAWGQGWNNTNSTSPTYYRICAGRGNTLTVQSLTQSEVLKGWLEN